MAGKAVRTRHSVRYRLLAIALLPMLVILPIFLGVAMYRWNARFDAMLLSKANGDLTIADQYMAQILEDMEASLQSLGASARFRDAMGTDPRSAHDLPALLGREARQKHYDFLYVVSAKNEIIASNVPLRTAAVRSDWPVLRAALAGKARTGIDLFSAADLQAVSPKLAEVAQIRLIPTEKAAPTTKVVETRGMVVHSAAPIRLPNGELAALVSGTLLNRNLRFVDTINGLVYHDASLPEGSAGTASLFIDDVRISTNVRLLKDQRAIGTRVSSAVRTAVLEHGENWLDSAFVVNDWYVSAYRPILDTAGRRAGMLYVGFLERPFTAMRREILLSISFAFLLVTGLTVPLFLKWATDIFRPLERMSSTISKVEEGDLAARTNHADGNDEIGQVAQHLDHLLEQVQDRDRQLREWNSELNRRVEERTEHLVRARKQIEDTTKQLVMAEKLAAIGEITAGVAHEINNPLAVMQGNLEIIRDAVGDRAAEVQFEFQLLDEQIQRIGDIVRKLLQFAKPAEYAGYEEINGLPQIVSDTMPLVEHLLKKTAIVVERDDHATHTVRMNKTELQQVLVNLIVNAVHAMPEGGTLRLRTFDQDRDDGAAGSAVAVTDTGTGMSKSVLKHIFDPFFTTKQHEGNGLGLSICQMLVLQAGGALSVESEPGNGTTFSVWLPDAAEAREDEGHSV